MILKRDAPPSTGDGLPIAGQAGRLAPWRATGALLLLLGIGLTLLFGVQGIRQRVSVDVLELLPRDELDPTIRLARQTVSGRFGRTLLIALSDHAHLDKAPTEAAAAMAAALSRDPNFNGAFSGLTQENKDRLSQWFLTHRLPLRLPFWFDAMRARWQKEKGPGSGEPDVDWLAAAAAADLQEFQGTPDALASQEQLPRDPLLLIPGLLAVFSEDDKSTAGEVAGGAMSAAGEDGTRYALVYAEIKATPLEKAGQQPVFDALQRELKAASAASGVNLAMRYSGVNKFAAESRERAESEIGLLTNISLAASCVLLLAAFRRAAVFVYLLLPIVTATVWSLVVCFLFFDRVHVVAIIFTTVLVGVALDYGIYTLTHAQKAGESMAQALREIRFPLIAGCLTSVGGFVFMTITNLPMLQQMGLAVALGLVFSLGLDFLYLPWLPAVHLHQRQEHRARHLSLGGRLFPMLALGMLTLAAALVYFAKVSWNDDIRTLQTMSPELQDEQTALRKLFGQSKTERIVITFAADVAGALANLEKFNAALAAKADASGERFFNLGRLLPTPGQSARAWDYFRAHGQFAGALRHALDAGFNADAFAPFWADWDAWMAGVNDPRQAPTAAAQMLAELRPELPLPLHNLWNDESAGSAWMATRISAPLYAKLPAEWLKAPNAPIDQVETLNGALTRYRITATQRAGIGLAVIAVCVMGVYGWRRGAFMLVVPTLGILLTVAALGFMRQSLGLLHVVALLLGFCLASDYSIFLASPGELPHSTRRAIRLAASTALLSFVVLSFSKINALHDICLTVTLVIGCVLVFCEVSYRLFVRVMGHGTDE
jgi:predicted exporter